MIKSVDLSHPDEEFEEKRKEFYHEEKELNKYLGHPEKLPKDDTEPQ